MREPDRGDSVARFDPPTFIRTDRTDCTLLYEWSQFNRHETCRAHV